MNLNTKLSSLKRCDLNCNIFDVYDYNGLSMQELLCQFFTKINECIDLSNDTIDLANWLVNEGLKQEVANKLISWLNDGTLEKLVNSSIINWKVNKSKVNIHAINMTTTGDCLFIEFNNGQNMIVDCGKKESASEVLNYLKNLGVEKIDYIFISHFDTDHWGGLETIIKNFNVDECKFIIPPTINYDRFLTDGSSTRNNEIIVRDLVVGRNVITPTENMEIIIDDDTKLKFNNCSPYFYEYYYSEVGEWTDGNTDYNNFSVVMTLHHMNNKMLFTSDINVKAQELLTPILEKCDLLKCHHHSVDTVSHIPYLDKVSPSIAITQCSGDNSIYTSQCSSYMWTNNIPYYATFKSGDIIVTSDGFKLNVKANRTFRNDLTFKNFANILGIENYNYYGFAQIKKKLYNSETSLETLIENMDVGTSGTFNFTYGYKSCPHFITSWGGGLVAHKYTSTRASLIAFDGNPSKFNVYMGLWHSSVDEIQWYKLTDYNEFKNKCNAQTYTTYSQMNDLGITTSSTVYDMVKSMPPNSTYEGFVNSNFDTKLSSWGGVVSIIKASNNKIARIQMTDANPSILTSWVGLYHEDNGELIVWK